MTDKVFKLVLPDSHFEQIGKLIDASEKKEFITKNKEGNVVRFVKENDELWSEEEVENDKVKREVIPESKVYQVKHDMSEFRKHCLKRLEEDEPNMTQEEREALADVFYEAHESVIRLVKAGVPLELAKKMIDAVMTDRERMGDDVNPEKIAKVLEEIASEHNSVEK